MPDPASPNPNPLKHAKDPNFLVVVGAAGVAALLFFISALLIVGVDGRHLLPRVQHDREPYSYLRQSPPASRFASTEASPGGPAQTANLMDGRSSQG